MSSQFFFLSSLMAKWKRKNLFFHCTHADDENGAKKEEKKMENVKKIFLKTNLRLLLMMMLVRGEINNCA